MKKNSNTFEKLSMGVLIFCSFLLLSHCSTMDSEDSFNSADIESFEDFDSSSSETAELETSGGSDELAEADLESEETSNDSESLTQETNTEDDFDEFAEFDEAGNSENEEALTSSDESQADAVEESTNVGEGNETESELLNESNEVSESGDSGQNAEISETPNSTQEVTTSEEASPQVASPELPSATPENSPAPEPETEDSASSSELVTPMEASQAPEPEVATANETSEKKVRITDMQYRVNDQGGTFMLQATGPLQFTQKMNPETNQLVIELENAVLPKHLQRPFNTKDFPGQIGSIDAYQMKGAPRPRIVIQLRDGASEPVIQSESNALFVVSGGGSAVIAEGESVPVEAPSGEMSIAANESGEETLSVAGEDTSTVEEAEPESPLFSADNLEDFLRSNQKFFGKKISIETDDMELRDIFKLISEESGINLVIADDVKGKMSLKLKNVPWDQALVMILKSKKLGYTRSGSILRVASMMDLRNEEEEALKIASARQKSQPIKVKTLTINYARVDDLEKQISKMLGQGASVVSDPRTSTIVITDQEENIKKAEQLVKSLDIPPQQVLIEGKIVEASDNFEKRIGITWGGSGREFQNIGQGATGPLRGNIGLNVTPGSQGASTLGINFSLGTLDILGDLTASLRLFELQGLVKVISSPRILALHNEKAQISQTTQIPLVTSTPAQDGTPIPSIEFKDIKLKLEVTPQVTNDGAVILGVDVMREVPGEVFDEKTGARSISSRAAASKVLIKNSQTAVIGGIYQNDSTESEYRVPGISNIPVIGWLFKSKVQNKGRTELLIFLTPRILGQMQNLPTATLNPSAPTLDGSMPTESLESPEAALDAGGFDSDLEEDNMNQELNSNMSSPVDQEENLSIDDKDLDSSQNDTSSGEDVEFDEFSDSSMLPSNKEETDEDLFEGEFE